MPEFLDVDFTTAKFLRQVKVLKGPKEEHITPLALGIKVSEGSDYLRILLGAPPPSPLVGGIKDVVDAVCLAAYGLYRSERPGLYTQCPELEKEKVDSLNNLLQTIRDNYESLSSIHSVNIEGDHLVFSFNDQT